MFQIERAMLAFCHDENRETAVIGRLGNSVGEIIFDEMNPRAPKNRSASKKTPVHAKRQPAAASVVGPKQIRLLRQSFALIEPQANIAALVFYRNLFTLDPSLRALFHTNIEVQGRKLMEALGFTVATLENPQALLPELEAMGRRHLTYGVRDEHYDTVLTALELTLEDVLGKAFTSEVRAAWKSALGLVVETMKRGAASVTALKTAVVEKS